MASISIQTVSKNKDESVFMVNVEDGGTVSTHKVSVRKDDSMLFTGKVISSEELVRQSFLFLLDRESKEAILREFTIRDIARYFPEYSAIMKDV